MRARVDAGTDVAMLGAWDASRQDGPIRVSGRRAMEEILADAKAGEVFLMKTGADGGGPVDIYVDEPLPSPSDRFKRCGSEHLLHLPTGRLLVGGAEDYRRAKPVITSAASIVQLAPGDYAIACHLPDEDTETAVASPSLADVLGAEDYRYFRRITRLSLCGYALLLLIFVLRPYGGWLLAFAATLAALGAYFWVQEKWVLARNSRYQSIRARVNNALKRAQAESLPTMILMLR